MPPPLTVGLTGGVASGKTLVETIFVELGVPVLDADQVSREVVHPPSAALDLIRTQFGVEFLNPDGSLNRARMRALVFADPEQRTKLEKILHPLMFKRIGEWRNACAQPYCVLSAAILLESGLRQLADRVLVVDAPAVLQRQRLRIRDGISESLASGMLAAQFSREQRLQSADDVVDNSGSMDETRRQVLALHQSYLGMAKRLPAGDSGPDLK